MDNSLKDRTGTNDKIISDLMDSVDKLKQNKISWDTCMAHANLIKQVNNTIKNEILIAQLNFKIQKEFQPPQS